MKRRAHPTESQEQAAIFAWAARAKGRYPELALLHAIPNGGDRHPAVGARMKREGVKRGVPDICLPVPRGEYHGLYIELKAHGGRVSDDQKAWHLMLEAQGYWVSICWGFDSARERIENYLNEKWEE